MKYALPETPPELDALMFDVAHLILLRLKMLRENGDSRFEQVDPMQLATVLCGIICAAEDYSPDKVTN